MTRVIGAAGKGTPLAMLGSVLAVWIMWRIVVWEMPLPQALRNISEVPQVGVVVLAGRSADLEADFPVKAVQEETESVLLETPWADPARFQAAVLVPLEPSAAGALAIEPAVAAGHQIMWMAAMAQLPMPSAVARFVRGEQTAQTAAPSGMPPPRMQENGRRWSMDGWLYLREGSQANGPSGIAPASYGASQAGAVLRYRIVPQSKFEPLVYTRATKALAAGRDADLAVGLSARPLPRLPLTANAELRATRVNGKTDLRPAAFAVLQPAPMPLPAGFSAEAYAQAGYVGGDFATGFADGQLRVTREIARFDLGAVSAGAGAWGGVQKGASRLDVGPSASLRFTLGEVPTRLSVDYRVRAAGDATPGNGAAVTLSTGF